jgi:Tfp pilus assembly protein PilN
LLLGLELAAGLLLHSHAGNTRAYLDASIKAQAQLEQTERLMAGPLKHAERLEREVTLARRLRATHYWSRLLAAVAQHAPETVVFKSISTEPPRWTRPAAETTRRPAAAANTVKPPAEDADVGITLNGVQVQGIAVEHRDLSELIAGVNQSGAFATVNLKEASRSPFLGQEAVSFQLECRW